MIIKRIFLIMLLLAATGIYAADNPYPDEITPDQPRLKSADDVTSLEYIGSCMWRGMGDAAIVGDYAYLAMNSGLKIIDISNPSMPVPVSQLHLELMWTKAIEVEGDYVYLIDNYELQIIDISDPAAPVLAGNCEIPSHYAYNLTLAGDYAVIASRSVGIQLIHIANPYSPYLAGSHNTPGDARSVVIENNTAFVADYNGGLQIIDISDPEALDSIGALGGIGYVQDIDIKDTLVYLACRSDGLRIVNIANPANPVLITTYPAAVTFDYVKVKGSVAYVADYSAGLYAVNITDPAAPSELGQVETSGKLAEVGDYASVVEYNDGLRLIDINDPQNPAIAGSFDTPAFGNYFALRDGYVYGVSASGLQVLDISDPSSPYLVGSTDEAVGYDLEVVDTIAYVSNTDSLLRLVNIANPAAPALVDTVQSVGYCYDVASDGQYTYLTTWQDGLVVVNVTDPSAAYIEAKYPAWGWSNYLEIAGDYLFIEDFRILDISDRVNPSLVGECNPIGTNNADIAIVDSLAYVAAGEGELMIGWLNIVNFADPANPYNVGTQSITNECLGVASDGHIACVTDYAGLYVVDVSNPVSPSLLAGTGGPGFCGVDMDGGYIYVASSYGFFVFRMTTVCGDANDDGVVNVGDPVYIIAYVFKGGPPPPWICKADANGDGTVNIGDAVTLIAYIFRDGPPPVDDCCP